MLAKRSLSWWSTSGPKAKLFTKIILGERVRDNGLLFLLYVHKKLQKWIWIFLIEAFSCCLVCCVTLCLLSFPSILQTESHLSPADKDDKNGLHVYIQKLSTMRNTTLTVYSPCFFPYHFIHFLNSLSMVCKKINIQLMLPIHSWIHQEAKPLRESDTFIAT